MKPPAVLAFFVISAICINFIGNATAGGSQKRKKSQIEPKLPLPLTLPPNDPTKCRQAIYHSEPETVRKRNEINLSYCTWICTLFILFNNYKYK